ncbi:unnamed protein product, partial [Nesidiocoris tenuis]
MFLITESMNLLIYEFIKLPGLHPKATRRTPPKRCSIAKIGVIYLGAKVVLFEYFEPSNPLNTQSEENQQGAHALLSRLLQHQLLSLHDYIRLVTVDTDVLSERTRQIDTDLGHGVI